MSQRLKAILLAAAVLPVAAACNREAASRPFEAPDSFNTLESFGIAKVFTYSDLLSYSLVRLPTVPWTDTYWPLVQQGLASRWTDEINPDAAKSWQEVKLGDFLGRFGLASLSNQPDPTLSPAEKYDLVFQYRHNVSLSAPKMLALTTQLGLQDLKIRTQSNYDDKRQTLSEMYKTFLSQDNLAMNQAMSMTVNGWKAFLDGSLDKSNKYLGLDAAPGADWSWEGHCHGWSPAAVMSRRPAHGVMALAGDKKIFFSEGDLRGLMTKAWADSSPDRNSYFLGRRCYQGDDPNGPIPANSDGRGFSGTLQMSASEPVVSFIVEDSLPDLLVVKLNNKNVQLNVYQISLDPSGEKLWLVEHFVSGGADDSRPDQYWVAKAFGDIARSVAKPEPLKDLKIPAKAQLTGCWDANPASFHQILVEQLGIRKIGFVMDRTRTSQVWNQPIYAARFQVGDLQAVGSVPDAFAKFHAASTAYLAEVKAAVYWVREPGHPELAYSDDFDSQHLTKTVYQYVLEFDAQQRVIGGEWGTLAGADPSAPSPDFLFGYGKGALPVDSYDGNTTFDSASIDYTGIIAKLHDCSLTPTTDGSVTVLGQQLPYQSCPISKL